MIALFEIGFVLLAVIGTYLPWTWWKGGAAFSVNLYDLAEWVSLVPRVRFGEPPLVAPGVLRLVPALVAIMLGVSAASAQRRWLRWLLRALALLLCVGLLPPIEFLRGQLGDPNYRQQAVIAILSGLCVLALLFRSLKVVALLAALLALMCGVVGFTQSRDIFATLKTQILIGPGLVLTLTSLVFYSSVLIIRALLKRKPIHPRA